MSTRIAVLCSGGGTNLQAVIDAVEAGKIDGEIVMVLSNASKAYALERARKHGIPAVFVSKKQAGSDEAFNDEILRKLKEVNAELVVLAGYLPIVGKQIVKAYEHRIINIHPALIPSFCGPGMYGHHVHEAVRASGDTETGITIHYVSNVCDGGEIIFQAKTPVQPGDTPDDIAASVHRLEQRYFPEVIERVIRERF